MRVWRGSLAVLVVLALIGEIRGTMGYPWFTYGDYFSYFTTLSACAAVVALGWTAARRRPKHSAARDQFRGVTTLAMAIAGSVFFSVLSGNATARGIHNDWTNTTLHFILPIALLCDWFFDPPSTRISGLQSMLWLLWPLAYLGFAEYRGHADGWWAYPFLDPHYMEGGARVAGGVLLLAVFIAIGAVAIAALGRAGWRRQQRRMAAASAVLTTQ